MYGFVYCSALQVIDWQLRKDSLIYPVDYVPVLLHRCKLYWVNISMQLFILIRRIVYVYNVIIYILSHAVIVTV